MQTVLVTAIGSFAADVVIRRLQELGLRVVGCDIYAPELVVDSMNVDVFYQAPYATRPVEYGAFVQDICHKEAIDAIVPLTDVEVDFYRRAAEEGRFAGAQVLISGEEALSLCRDKAAMAAFLKISRSGVRGIETTPLADYGDEVPELPVVVKPLDGRSSQGLSRVYSESEWRAATSVDDPERYIVQPLIEGYVVAVDVIRSKVGNPVVSVPRRELLRTLNGAGTSVCVFTNEELARQCAVLADELGTVGCVNFEFIETPEGQYYFLECNPRFSGGVEFTCMAAYDCVGNHLRAFAGEAIEELVPYNTCYIARKYEEFVTKVEGK